MRTELAEKIPLKLTPETAAQHSRPSRPVPIRLSPLLVSRSEPAASRELILDSTLTLSSARAIQVKVHCGSSLSTAIPLPTAGSPKWEKHRAWKPAFS